MDRRRGIMIGMAVAMTLLALLLLRRDKPAKHAAPGLGSTAVGAGGGGTGSKRTPDPRDLPVASMAGTVRDDAGAPIAGAWVCAQSYTDALADDDTREPRCTDTDVAGAWRLASLWPARWSVEAGAERRIPAAWQDAATHDGAIRLRAGEDRTGLDLVLRGGGVACDGTVLDLTGGPIAGATVMVGGQVGAGCHTHSNDDGTFRCWVAPGEGWASATADGYTDGWASTISPGGHVEVLLTPESVLGGVVMQAGAPVPGARVTAGNTWGQGPTTFTDAAGRFRFARLAPDRYALSAEIEGAYGEAGESVRIGLADTRDDLVIELFPATPVKATVSVDGATPTPAEGCTVSLARADGRRYEDTTDAGAVAFAAVQPGTYQVAIDCEQYIARSPYPELVVAAQPVAASWLVAGGPTLRGIVVDDTGAPAGGVVVSARNVGGDPRAARGGGRDETGADGRFVIAGLTAGQAEINASSVEHPRLDPPLTVELAADADVTVTLTAGGTITGTVVDDTGARLANLDVRALGNPGGGSARTADDGTFTLRGLRAGPYRVIATRDWNMLRKPGTIDDDVQGESVTVAAGKPATVQLVVESAAGVIRGHVVDADGQPITDAFVRVEREPEGTGKQRGGALRGARWEWSKRPAVTDTGGAFEVGKLAPGRYSVLAFRKGGSEAHAEGVAVGETVTLTITPTGSISGTVVTGATPPEELKISLVDPATGVQRYESFFRTAGAWTLHDLPAGTYDLTATSVAGTATIEHLALADGEQRTGVEIELRAMVTVTGRVIDEDTKAPVPAMRVMVGAVDGAGGGFSFGPGDDGDQISDDSGRFTVKDVPQGRVRVYIRPKDYGTSDYLRGQSLATLTAPGPIDLGDLIVVKRRTPRNGAAGDLGFTLAELPPDTDPTAVVLTVATVRKGGPAEPAGLKPDDVIVAIDGHDCRGEESWQFSARSRVPVGTVVDVGLARGDTLKIKAGDPP